MIEASKFLVQLVNLGESGRICEYYDIGRLTFRELSVVRKMPRDRSDGQGICRVIRRQGWDLLPRMEVSTSAKVPHAEFFPPRRRRGDRAAGSARLDEDRRELVRFWPVIQNMVVGELRVRYQRSILGFVWTLLNPLLMMVILSWVFSYLMTEL